MIPISNFPGLVDSHYLTTVDGHTIVTAGKMVSFGGASVGASASKVEKNAGVQESKSEDKKKSRFSRLFQRKSSSKGSRSSYKYPVICSLRGS